MTTNRETVRDRIVSDLKTILVTNNSYAKDVVGYRLREPKTQPPQVQVLSAGTQPAQLTFGEIGSDECCFYFNLEIIVPAAESGWKMNPAVLA